MFSPFPMKREFEQDFNAIETDTCYTEDHLYKRARHNYLNSEESYPVFYDPLAADSFQSIFDFQILSEHKKGEPFPFFPFIDSNVELYPSTLAVSPSLFSKKENPVFCSTLSEWQTLLNQGESLISQPETDLKPKAKPRAKKAKIAKEKPSSVNSSDVTDKEKINNVAGDSKNYTLKDMCRKGLIRQDDIIIYKRNFSASKTVVSKTMTVLEASGLSGITIQLDDETYHEFETPTALETKILDYQGKVTKDKRPNGNAFKSIRLIRAGKDLGRLFDIRKDSFDDLC
ncbi:hypothetical protein BY458DRAFT_429637 [Sporodiniella umbellata]|nr:hypothetical protein BY458DRAFT_429637 [Sporodiniella umbellata]